MTPFEIYLLSILPDIGGFSGILAFVAMLIALCAWIQFLGKEKKYLLGFAKTMTAIAAFFLFLAFVCPSEEGVALILAQHK